MAQKDPYFFGYGSLVNRATHDFPGAERARLRGWRRHWRHTSKSNIAFLTVVPDETCEIEGLIARVPNADWAALDLREYAYDRLPATEAVSHPVEGSLDIAVYVVPEDPSHDPARLFPVLLSYIDVVVQGFLREFGEAGAQRFFDTTSGWDTPIIHDRAAPRYPRHQQLSTDETALLDHHLEALNVGFIAG